ncbi:uncharacterized protein LOC119996968 [Tripterygium wilfordii]|uniref:uncharacterized protein LOC119996968 n=1 Tax=Tripterygium wilfordii TaxID=458696 RepID=UPI0018F7E6BC|nr:uncharacterized protein LOC119996968 [Tripterygium wilfordii]
MARTRRRRRVTILSEEEAGQHVQASTNSNNGAHIEENGDSQVPSQTEATNEVEVDGIVDTIDTQGVKRTRGRTRLADVWELPADQRIIVPFNDLGQPIKAAGGLLGQFLDSIAKNGELCSLAKDDWRKFTKPEIQEMLKVVEGKFYYDDCYDYWVLKTIARRWRDYKCHLKCNIYHNHDIVEEVIRNRPSDVDEAQWKRSEINTTNRKKQKIAHTSGTKSFARKAEEMREKTGVNPTRAKLFLETHKKKAGEKLTAEIEATSSKPSHTTSIASENDAYAALFGKEHAGRVRGIGTGPPPTQVFGTSSRRRFNGMSFTSSNSGEMQELKSMMMTMMAQIGQLSL